MDDDIYSALLADAIAGSTDPLEGEMPSARVLRRRHKLRLVRMLQQQTLADAVAAPPAPGETIHAISNGKYDFATWIPQIVDWYGRADCLWCSTWTLSRPNADDVFSLHDSGNIARGQLHFLTGLYFKRRETATYNYLLDGLLKRGGRFKAFENHAKVLLIASAQHNAWITVEGSANLNANPRLEQYAITNDSALFDFHRGWMEEVFASKAHNYRSTTTAREKEFRGYSIRRAGLGVTVYSKHHRDQQHLIREKLNPPFDPAAIARRAEALIRLIRAWFPQLPAQALVTPPPQGASWPGPYYAAALAEAVATQLGLPYLPAIERTDPKRYRHPLESLRQSPFVYVGPSTAVVLVIDDIITSGTTMRRCITAAIDARLSAYGFAFYGA